MQGFEISREGSDGGGSEPPLQSTGSDGSVSGGSFPSGPSSGGPIPGAPPELPTPLNLTPDATGLQGWSYEQFQRAVTTGVRKNGQTLNQFMPRTKFDEIEAKALWAYLSTLPARPFGGR